MSVNLHAESNMNGESYCNAWMKTALLAFVKASPGMFFELFWLDLASVRYARQILELLEEGRSCGWHPSNWPETFGFCLLGICWECSGKFIRGS